MHCETLLKVVMTAGTSKAEARVATTQLRLPGRNFTLARELNGLGEYDFGFQAQNTKL